jgi:UDPglucose 6-dehydrogenase
MNLPTIGFAGMTHLGLVSAVAAAAAGCRTVGWDKDAGRMAEIAAGRLPVIEPDLDALAHSHGSRLSFTADVALLSSCDVVYIAADVPTDETGTSDLAPIDALVAEVRRILRRDAFLVILCQVPPGYTRRLDFPAERLFYQVETLVFGRAVERATKPERFIVGCADPARPLPPPYHRFLETFGCPILPMRYESAELAKIAINCCLVASVTVANTLGELSERLGADWSEIAPALKLDRRIGAYSYLTPGLGLSGGNLERDLATVLRLSLETGSEAGLVTAFLRNSRHRRDWPLRVLHEHLLAASTDPVIAVLGLAYKENTHSTKNSPSLALLRHLGRWRVRLYDPVVPASASGHPRAEAATSALDAVCAADAVALMTPWPEFRALAPEAVARAMRGRLVIDPHRLLDPAACAAAGLEYLTLGAPPPRQKGRSDA